MFRQQDEKKHRMSGMIPKSGHMVRIELYFHQHPLYDSSVMRFDYNGADEWLKLAKYRFSVRLNLISQLNYSNVSIATPSKPFGCSRRFYRP